MAIITPAGWTTRTGITPAVGADATSIAQFCTDVSEALTRLCYPIAIEPKTLDLFACDAPLDNRFLTPIRPCRSITALYLVPGADGDSSLVSSDTLLANFTGYVLDIDDALTGWSRSGFVYRRGASAWGVEYHRRLNQLAPYPEPNKKAIFISGTFGPDVVSAAVAAAAAAAVTLMFERRSKGAPFQSESFGGYSYSGSAPFTAEAAINSPEVMGLLRSAGVLPIHVPG